VGEIKEFRQFFKIKKEILIIIIKFVNRILKSYLCNIQRAKSIQSFYKMDSKDTIVNIISPRRKWITLGILFFVNLLNYMDRYTVSAILDDFSEEMCGHGKTCSTSKQGLIQTAFVVIYMASAPMFGYFGDRYSRKYLMALGVFIWGSLSLTASFMPSYWYFLITRALIAIGESAFTTIAPTVLGDLFTEQTRSLVYGIFYVAIPFGTGLGFVVGGAPSEWRWGLRITPGLTFLAAVLILLFLYDPPRGESEGKTISNRSSYMEDLKYIAGIKSFVLNAAGFTCVTFTTGALAWFAPVYITNGIHSRELPMGCCNCSDDPNWSSNYTSSVPEENVTLYFGIVTCVGGLLGVISGMLLSKYLRPRYQWVDPVICGVSLLLSIPFLVGGILLAKDHLEYSFVVILFGMYFLNFNWSVAVDMTIYVITPARRSTAEAIHLMMTHAIGEAGAPYLVGLLADGLKSGIREDNSDYCPDTVDYFAIQYSLFLPFVLLFLGGVLFLIATIWVVRDKESVDSEARTVNTL